MKAYRDTCNPLAAHTVRLGGVGLVFGDDGLLRNPSAEQLAIMKAHPLRQARFVEIDVEEQKPAPTAAAKDAAAPTRSRGAAAKDEPAAEEKPS